MVNNMGSEVVEGFKCKPKELDVNKPIMHFKTQIFICNGERCGASKKSQMLADELRDVLKELGLGNGEKRIKISRTHCFGACRFKQVGIVFENTRANGYLPNNNIWLKQVNKYSKEKWAELFSALANNQNLDNFEQIEMQNC